MTHSRIAHGGKAVYGARVGILMLEAQFPRIPGDMGNAETWPFPVLYKVVKGASPDRVVRRQAEGLLDAFCEAARELVATGADGITTNCGFLSIYQRDVAAAAGVPVAISSLMQAPFIQSTLPPGKRVGILTISAATMTPRHLQAIGVDPTIPIVGTDGGREFTRAILNDEPRMDVALAEQDVVNGALELVSKHGDIGAVLLECTNMCPYARAVAEAVRLPVFDIYSFVTWFHSGLRPRDFGHPASAARDWRER